MRAHRLPRDGGGDEEERQPVRERGEHLEALEPVGPLPVGRPRRHAHGKPGEPERGGVGQHVTGVGDERQRSRVDAADQLGEHCPGGEQAGPEQPALVRISAAVIVAVIVAHVVP